MYAIVITHISPIALYHIVLWYHSTLESSGTIRITRKMEVTVGWQMCDPRLTKGDPIQSHIYDITGEKKRRSRVIYRRRHFFILCKIYIFLDKH